jgi:hypothetical protein
VTHSPYARAPDLTVTLSRIAVQYLTLIFHQHTEAKDVITSKSAYLRLEQEKYGVGEAPNLRASVECGCVFSPLYTTLQPEDGRARPKHVVTIGNKIQNQDNCVFRRTPPPSFERYVDCRTGFLHLGPCIRALCAPHWNSFLPSSPEALRTYRREEPLLAREGNGREFSQQPVIHRRSWDF